MKTEKRYTEGYFIGVGIAIGLPLGVPIGLILGNIALGFVFGLPFGLAIGIVLEKLFNKNPIPLTLIEKRRQKKWSQIGVGIGLIVFLTISITYYLVKI